jgi:Helix-turn-helix domain
MATRTAVRHLSPEALSERLDVPVATLRDWRNQNRGPAYIRGESDGDKATIRYPLAEVEAWEQRQLVKTST